VLEADPKLGVRLVQHEVWNVVEVRPIKGPEMRTVCQRRTGDRQIDLMAARAWDCGVEFAAPADLPESSETTVKITDSMEARQLVDLDRA
jgi:hypothetical protein